MAPSKQRTSTTFHVKLSKTRSPLYSIIFVICERVGFILHVTKGRLHLQSDGLYFEGGVFSCPFAVPVVTCTKVLPATSRRETEPAPDLVEPFCCTLDFGFRILLRDRGNIGPSFSDVNRTIIPTTISVHASKSKYRPKDEPGSDSPSANRPIKTPMTIEATAAHVDTTTALPSLRPLV